MPKLTDFFNKEYREENRENRLWSIVSNDIIYDQINWLLKEIKQLTSYNDKK